MLSVAESFATTYGQARKRFLEAAVVAGLALESHGCPEPGPDGEALALDAALDLPHGGPADAARLLVLANAGTPAGSGVLAFALNDEDWRSRTRAAGVAVLYVHTPWLALDESWRVAALRAVLGVQAARAGKVSCMAIGRVDEALRQAVQQACPQAVYASLALEAANPPSRGEPLHPDTWKGIAISQSRQAMFQALAELA